MKIWAHTIVHNEEGFIWYAVMSVIDYVDKIIIYDTGSTDRTPHILKEIKKVYKKKVSIKTCGPVDKYQFSSLRQEMLDRSHCDWIIILDGDEVWWYDSVRRVEDLINREGTKLNAIAVPFYNVIGDIYHYQEEIAGRYKLLGREGNLQIKAINRKIPGLHIEQPYGSEGFYDKSGNPVQTLDRVVLLEAPHLHLTFLSRSHKLKLRAKFKYELGIPFPSNFDYPEVLYLKHPSIVKDPWENRSMAYILRAFFETLIKKLKRRIVR